MKAIVATAVNKLEMLERPMPTAGEGMIVLQVKATGICQTDLDILKGLREEPEWQPPRVLGHEISGVVHEIGPGVIGLAVGQVVVVDPVWACGHCFYCDRGTLGCENGRLIGGSTDGGMQEYVAIPARNAIPMPKGMPFELAAIIEPFACVLTAFGKAIPEKGDTVVVSGPGIGGLCFTQLAKSRGARVILAGTKDDRLALGKKLGADITVNVRRESLLDAVLGETEGRGAAIYYEASGNGKTYNDALRMTRISGTVVGYGNTLHPIEGFDMQTLLMRDLAVVSGAGPWQTFQEAAELLAAGTVKLDDFLTHTFSPEQAAEAYAMVEERPEGMIKAAIVW